ncbi:MAG: hypothetical protein AB4206_20600 [Xenococcaceae cyanobacterium]
MVTLESVEPEDKLTVCALAIIGIPRVDNVITRRNNVRDKRTFFCCFNTSTHPIKNNVRVFCLLAIDFNSRTAQKIETRKYRPFCDADVPTLISNTQ